MSEPPKVDIVLLRREGARWTEEQLRLLCDGLRGTKASNLLIEFKYTESFNEDALLQAVSYAYFYGVAQALDKESLQTFVMLARTPRRQLLDFYGYEADATPGVYRSQQGLARNVQLIVLNQLEPSAHNAFVQCFASRRRIYQNAFARIRQFDHEQLSESVWELVAGLRNQRDKKEGVMAKNEPQEGLTAEKLIEIGKETRKFVLATLSSEDRVAGLTADDLALLPPEKRLAGLAPEDRLAGITPEELPRLMAEIETYLRQSQSHKANARQSTRSNTSRKAG